MNKFEKYSFLFVVFILGISSLFGIALSMLLIPLIGYNIYRNPRLFISNLKRFKVYIFMPLFFCIYILLHFFVNEVLLHNEHKASMAIFETMLCYFFIIPLYILSLKSYLTTDLLKKALPVFASGVILLNIIACISLLGSKIITEPIDSLTFLFESRFGGNSKIFGLYSLLEPRSMTTALAALLALFSLVINKKIYNIFLAIILIVFLAFTSTKAAILALFVGLLFVGIFTFKVCNKRYRLFILLGFISMIFIPISLFSFSHSSAARITSTITEVKNVFEHKIEGGSIAPRIFLWRCAFKHFNEYAIFGQGLYYKDVFDQWILEIEGPAIKVNFHNSLIDYWVKGGLLGLAMILSYFIFPLIRLCKKRLNSFLVIGILSIFFITSNTCVLFSISNSLGIVMFFLALSYFFAPSFAEIENNRYPDLLKEKGETRS